MALRPCTQRYRANHDTLLAAMRALGFHEYLPRERQSDIITSFHYPEHAGFSFAEFYRQLAKKGFVIYPGKVSQADCFRIGTIGQISPLEVTTLVREIENVLARMCPKT